MSLAIFDNHVRHDAKDWMVEAMTTVDGLQGPPKRATVQAGSMMEKIVADFATKTSKKLFTRLDLEDDFLKSPA